MRATLNLPRSEKVYELALEGLARVNDLLYRQDPNLPGIYEPRAGVQYRREPTEVWRHAQDVIRDRWGDCEDLAAARVGELRARHDELGAKIIVRRTGRRLTHALVRRASGRIEDPSRKLGMGKPEVPIVVQAKPALSFSSGSVPTYLPSSRQDEISPDENDYDGTDEEFEEIGADVSRSAELSWTVDKTANGWRGTVRVPLELGKCLLVSRSGKTEEAAAKKSLSAASRVLDSDIAKALIPPQAQFALKFARSPAAQKIAKSILGKFKF